MKSKTKLEKKRETSLIRKSKKDDDDELRFNKCMNRIRFLESRLRKYEKVIPFDPNADYEDTSEEIIDYEVENDKINEVKEKEKNIFIDDEDESHQRVVCQIGEGSTSTVYKVIDEQHGETICKKVLKAIEGKTTFKDFQNILKEFSVLEKISHPSICKCIGLNPQEKINSNNNSSSEEEKVNDDDDDEIDIRKHHKSSTTSEKKKKTTIAIFLIEPS